MLRAGLIRRNVGQIDLGLLAVGQFDLGFLRRLFETLQRQRIVVQIHAVFFFEFISQEIDDLKIKVFTTQECVTIRG